MDLHHQVLTFVKKWGPRRDRNAHVFIDELRELMNSYALAAIQHGNLPEEGAPHGELTPKAAGDCSACNP